jgi:hypothetical protein
MTTKKVQSRNRLHQPTKLEARRPLSTPKTGAGTTTKTGGGSQTPYLQYNLTEVYISH